MTPLINYYTHPTHFMRISGIALPWLTVASIVALAIAFYVSLFVAPEDYRQGQTVRIMFLHVPAAWLALGGYVAIAIASVTGRIWKRPLADVAARAIAPTGACFTFIVLLTGSLWGKPMWGIWWVWDARLTSVAILLLLYLGYIALWNAIEEPTLAARAAGALALIGVVNVPIIHFSVSWWNTLHQPASVLRFDGPTIHPTLLLPLLLMFVALSLLMVTITLARMRLEILRRRTRMLRLRSA